MLVQESPNTTCDYTEMVIESAHLKSISFLAVLVSITVTNTLAKSNFGEERFYLAYNSTSQPRHCWEITEAGAREDCMCYIQSELREINAPMLTAQLAFFTLTQFRAQPVK